MNQKIKDLLKNFSYTIVSNAVSLVISVLVVLIIPKIIGVKENGYWQLYMFYSSYVGFLHFGWNDGIYLRYGGEKYKDLDKPLFFSQFIMLSLSQILFCVVGMFIVQALHVEADVYKILNSVLICMVIVNVRYLFLFVLQATSRIKEYANVTMIDRLIYIGLVVMLLFMKYDHYQLMIYSDIIGKFLSLLLAMYYCLDIVKLPIKQFKWTFGEAKENIRVGSKLMLSTIAGMLIIGIVRMGIKENWGIETFGKISLIFSISNLMMTFINAIGIVLFPMLRQTKENNLAKIYKVIQNILMVLLLGALLLYYPLKMIITLWLPNYAGSLKYLTILFPMFIYEGKMALLTTTYLKTLRKEKELLKVNVLVLVLSVIMTIVNTVLVPDLDRTVLSILVLLMLRSIIADRYVAKLIRVDIRKEVVLEVGVTLAFLIIGWNVDSFMNLVYYAGVYVIYLWMKREDLRNLPHDIRMLT